MSSPLNPRSLNNDLPNYQVINGKKVQSLFGTGNQFVAFPGVNNHNSAIGDGKIETSVDASTFYSDDATNISTSSIINYTSKIPSMKLTYADFAYLRNVGVYPNNRLMIARRFSSGVSSDLTSVKTQPMSTLISWVPDGEDFISVQYGEIWEEAAGSFTDILNDIGGDIKASQEQGSNLGDSAAGLFGALPLPGFMEGIQYEVMKRLGITEAGIGNSPLGNPNLIRKAKQRALVSKNQAGSGLMCQFTIKMVVEYEQKYINGVDPSLVYLDIIQNALTFGTSDAFFQFNSKFQKSTSDFIKNLISGDIGAIAKALSQFVEALLGAIGDIGGKIIAALINPPKDDTTPSVDSILSAVTKAFASTIGHVISKYKIKLLGVSNALTGSPSGPWHISIGNPKKPLFCSGDMIVDDVTITLGKNLSFNDLPSSIKLEFSLKNARPLGAQEIFTRFNTGRGRSYARLQSSYGESTFGFTSSTKETGTSTTGGPSASTYRTTQTSAKITNETVSDPFLESGGTSPWISGPVVQQSPQTGSPVENPVVQAKSEVQPSKASVSTVPNSTVTTVPPAVEIPTPSTMKEVIPTTPPPPTSAVTPVNSPAVDNTVPGYVDGKWKSGVVIQSGIVQQDDVVVNWYLYASKEEGTYIGDVVVDGVSEINYYRSPVTGESVTKNNAETALNDELLNRGQNKKINITMKLYDIDKLMRDPKQDDLYNFFDPTFKMNKDYPLSKYVVPQEFEMRIDLISNDIYGSVDESDFLLSLNDISNPMNIKYNDELLYVDYSAISEYRVKVVDQTEARAKLLNSNKTTRKDNTRQKYVEEKYSLPPTLKDTPAPAVQVIDNQIVIGG